MRISNQNIEFSPVNNKKYKIKNNSLNGSSKASSPKKIEKIIIKSKDRLIDKIANFNLLMTAFVFDFFAEILSIFLQNKQNQKSLSMPERFKFFAQQLADFIFTFSIHWNAVFFGQRIINKLSNFIIGNHPKAEAASRVIEYFCSIAIIGLPIDQFLRPIVSASIRDILIENSSLIPEWVLKTFNFERKEINKLGPENKDSFIFNFLRLQNQAPPNSGNSAGPLVLDHH